jgi:hypothetical protein
MKISDIPFGTTDWSSVERTEHKGETGVAYWRTFVLKRGMSYHVADGAEPHRSYTAVGAKLFIVD